jgi:8-oxo-dGTP pyrophosphatase MutT (NUDIX family)
MSGPFDLPRDRIFAIRDYQLRLEPGPHPIEHGNEQAIAANWERELRAKPAIFDGEVALLASLVLEGDVLVGRCHMVRYSTFLYWRSLRPVAIAEHSFANAAIVSADDALVAIRMAGATVNGGMVYFASGSFEPDDFNGALADVDANMRREVLEETGLDLKMFEAEPRLHALSKVVGTVVFRRYRSKLTADEIAWRPIWSRSRGGTSAIRDGARRSDRAWRRAWRGRTRTPCRLGPKIRPIARSPQCWVRRVLPAATRRLRPARAR